MRRPGLLLKSPASPWTAFLKGFLPVVMIGGAVVPVKILLGGDFDWPTFIGFLPIFAVILFGAGAVCGLCFAVPVMIEGWAWRKIADDTPVSEQDEGLSS